MDHEIHSIEKMKAERKVQLKWYLKLTHYIITFISIGVITIALRHWERVEFRNFQGGISLNLTFILLSLGIVTAVISTYIRSKELRFKSIPLNEDQSAIISKLKKKANESDWILKQESDNCLLWLIDKNLFSWGQLVYVIIEPDQVLVNSIANPLSRGNLTSFGANKAHINTVKSWVIETEKRNTTQ
jgi:hypothetical protein